MESSTYQTLLVAGSAIFAIYYLTQVLFGKVMVWRAQLRWKNTRKDKVILHQPPRGLQIVNLSPFCVKLETYLRMAKIDHEVDTSDALFGPSRKFPWISLNGQHYTDTEFIIAHLGKKFDKSFGKSYSKEQLAVATAVRIMLEEHFLFGGVALWRYCLEGRHRLSEMMKLNPAISIWFRLYNRYISTMCYYQGIGRRSPAEIQTLMTRDLEVVSELLGNKNFFLGNEPCEADCAIFAFTSQTMWGLPGSPYEKIVNERFTNIRDYSIRMKELYFPDWDNLLDRK